MTDTLISNGALSAGLKVRDNTDYIESDSEYELELAYVFTTANGSWDVSDNKYSVPSWARAKFLKPPSHPEYHDNGGGDHHLFVGVFLKDARHDYYTDIPVANIMGQFSSNNWVNTIREFTDESGWCNIPITGFYVPPSCGPWSLRAKNAKKEVTCAGLPGNNHVSTYVAYYVVERDLTEPPIDPPVDPPEEVDLEQALNDIEHHAEEILTLIDELRK